MSNEFKRPDGRTPNKIRDIKVEVGILDRANGSARVHLGNNLAIASVFGPRELHPKHASLSDKALVRVNYRMATFSVTDYKKSFPSRREKEISKVLSDAFNSVVITKSFPRSAIDVHVQLFQSDGGTRTAAAIAVSAALADAGIPMRDLTGGIASGIYEDNVVLDLTGKEDMTGTGDMPILYSPTIDEVSLFQLDGLFTFDQFKQAFNYSVDAIKSVVETIKEALREKYLKVSDELSAEEEVPEEEIAMVSSEGVVEDAPTIEATEIQVDPPVSVDTPVADEIKTPVKEEPTFVESMPPIVEKSTPETTARPVPNVDSTNTEIAMSEDEKKEFDRSRLRLMGGIIQDSVVSDENLKQETKEEDKKEKEEPKEDDILRDIEYSNLEEDL